MRMQLAAGLFLLGCSRALAADGASLNAIGYSPDSRYFAFEQYGIQDGSGFNYWDIFIIDLKNDQLMPGSPVRALIEDEKARLSDARKSAYERATPLLQHYVITEPAAIIAANPSTEVVTDHGRIAFERWYLPRGATPDTLDSSLMRHDVSVSTMALPAPENCPEEDGPYSGFSLTLKDVKLGTSHVIHTDKAIPASRGCAIAYDLAAIVAPANVTDEDRLVAMVGVYSRGFEGAGQRFIAVPFVLSD